MVLGIVMLGVCAYALVGLGMLLVSLVKAMPISALVVGAILYYVYRQTLHSEVKEYFSYRYSR